MQGLHQPLCAEPTPAPSPPGSPVTVAPTQALEELQHWQQQLLVYPPPRSIYRRFVRKKNPKNPSLYPCQASWRMSRVDVQLLGKGNNCSGGHKVQLNSSSAALPSPRVLWHQQGPEGKCPGIQDTHKFPWSHPVERCSTRTISNADTYRTPAFST